MKKYFIPLLGIGFSLAIFSCNNSNVKVSEPAVKANDEKPNELFDKYQLSKIKLPAGFKIEVYAEVKNARSLTLSPTGVLYVGNRSENSVYAVVDEDKDGKADKVYKIASGLESPNGVAFKNGNLYIATISTIYRLDSIESSLGNPPKPVVVYDKYPKDTHHGWKFIAFGPDGKLYVPVGAPCNICDPKEAIYSSITRINDDGTGFEIVAKGIRNTVGFDWNPQTKNLWFTDNGRDMMGDDVPTDELNEITAPNQHFGFPYCHQGNLLDPEFGKGKNCADYKAPIQNLSPHAAALGMRFYTGKMFGDEYTNKIFIAEHGSWNRTTAIGYRVVTVSLNADGTFKGFEVFADGWLQDDGKVIGRPADVLVMPDGALLISDDFSGAVYRVSKS